jgi:isopenicillin N synthase-like dioxygenase
MISPQITPEIPIADLEIISYDKLLEADSQEIGRLVENCKSLGFFYLNLTGTAQCVLNDSNSVFRVMEEYFDQPLSAKLEDVRHSVTHG